MDKKEQLTPFDPRIEKVFCVRHGEYDPKNGALTAVGREQARRVGGLIGAILPETAKISLCASKDMRTIETAATIEMNLLQEKKIKNKLNPGEFSYLSGLLNHGDRNLPALLKELRDISSLMAENLILTGHMEVSGSFLGFYALQVLGRKGIPSYEPLQYGEATYLDLRTGEYRKL